MTLHAWPVRLGPSLALLSLAGGFLACNQIFGIAGGSPEGSGGHGGAGSTSASGSSTSTSASSTSSTGSATSSSTSTSSTGSTSTSSSSGVLAGCVLLLHMDEPSWTGTGSVKDSSGHGNDGAPSGTAATTAAGKFGRAGLFDGNGWVVVPDAASLHPTVGLTYAAWVYPTGLTDGTASPGIVSKRDGFATNVTFTLFLWTSNNVWADLQGPTTGSRFNSTAVVGNNQWYHLAIVYDGAAADPNKRASIYVNGALDSVHPADPSLAINTADIQIGNLPGGGNPLTGRIDEVAVWTRALGAAEIAALAAATGPL